MADRWAEHPADAPPPPVAIGPDATRRDVADRLTEWHKVVCHHDCYHTEVMLDVALSHSRDLAAELGRQDAEIMRLSALLVARENELTRLRTERPMTIATERRATWSDRLWRGS